MTLIGAVLGVVLAKSIRRWARHPQQTFVRCVALTAFSIVPDLTTGFDAAGADARAPTSSPPPSSSPAWPITSPS